MLFCPNVKESLKSLVIGASDKNLKYECLFSGKNLNYLDPKHNLAMLKMHRNLMKDTKFNAEHKLWDADNF